MGCRRKLSPPVEGLRVKPGLGRAAAPDSGEEENEKERAVTSESRGSETAEGQRPRVAAVQGKRRGGAAEGEKRRGSTVNK